MLSEEVFFAVAACFICCVLYQLYLKVKPSPKAQPAPERPADQRKPEPKILTIQALIEQADKAKLDLNTLDGCLLLRNMVHRYITLSSQDKSQKLTDMRILAFRKQDWPTYQRCLDLADSQHKNLV